MSTVSAELDAIQEHLHDAAALWSRAELLRWWNDGYCGLVVASGAVRRITPFDIPSGVTYAVTYEWEKQLVEGTTKKFTRTVMAGQYEATALWEAEHLADVPVTASLGTVTQDWERSLLGGETDVHMTFVFPANHDRVLALYYNDRRLEPIGVRSLDESDAEWWQQVGQPYWWTTGTGPVRTVEIYQIQTAVSQGYAYSNTYPYGIPRSFSGTRTYSVDGSAYGVIRQILAPDRQYLPITTDLATGGSAFHGRIVEWRSSEDSIMAVEIVGPDRDLAEADVPSLLPSQALKYVRAYVWSQCFGRRGEGYRPILRDHYRRRFERGVAFWRKLANLAYHDRGYTRQDVVLRNKAPALVRLPDTFQRVW